MQDLLSSVEHKKNYVEECSGPVDFHYIDIFQNIIFCVLQKKEGHAGLELQGTIVIVHRTIIDEVCNN